MKRKQLKVKQTSCCRKESENILETWKIRVATPVDLLLLNILFVTEKKKRARARERKLACESANLSLFFMYISTYFLFYF